MKKSYLILFIFLYSCTPKIIEKFITHKYSNLNFEPTQISNSNMEGLEITVIPIDAKKLDLETFMAASRDGNYEKEFATEVELEKERNARLKNSERDNLLDFKIKALESIDQLVQTNEITADVGILFKFRIWRGPEEGKDGSEIESLTQSRTSPNMFNPYILNNRYLSLFKITIENTSSEIKKIGIEDFQVLAKEELLSPYEISFFESNLDNNTEKLKNIHRFNMPKELIITPSQKVSKYIAIPGINQNKKSVIVQYINENKFIDFKFDLSMDKEEKVHNLTEYKMLNSGNINSASYFFVINYDGGAQFPTIDNNVYVDNEKSNLPVSIYGIGLGNISKRIYFSKIESVKFSEFNKNVINMNFSLIKK
jgi:hypothetical protein